MKSPFAIAFAAILMAFVFPVVAEEKNGLLVNVTKRTLERGDRREAIYFSRDARTQGLKMTVKNNSLRAFGEGEVTWTLLVRKPYAGTVEKYEGSETLKPLRSAEGTEIMIGAVPVASYRLDRNYKDELEYDILISHAGKETIRLTSMMNFLALARGATLMTPPVAEAAAPAPARIPGAPDTAPAATPPVPAGAPLPPGTAAAPAPGTPPMPATAGGIKPAPAEAPVAPPAEPAVDVKPFDFFNLGKKAPPAK